MKVSLSGVLVFLETSVDDVGELHESCIFSEIILVSQVSVMSFDVLFGNLIESHLRFTKHHVILSIAALKSHFLWFLEGRQHFNLGGEINFCVKNY